MTAPPRPSAPCRLLAFVALTVIGLCARPTAALAVSAVAAAPVTVTGTGLAGGAAPESRAVTRAVRRAGRGERRAARRALRRMAGVSGPGATGQPRDRERKIPNGLAVAGFVCALSFLVTAPIGPILGIVFGAVALRRNRLYPEVYGRRRMALAALILGIVFTALYALQVARVVVALGRW